MSAEPFDADRAAIVAMLEAMGYRSVDVGWSTDRKSVLIHASRERFEAGSPVLPGGEAAG